MTTRALFFDSQAGDRVYNAADWEAMVSAIVTDGYVPGLLEELLVEPSTPTAMSVRVNTGRAVINGKVFDVDADETLVIPDNASGSPRVDRIVARVDYTNRVGTLAVKQGTPAANPSPPGLQRDASAWEISLAQVYVANGAVQIVAGDITDERNNPSVAGRSKVQAGASPTGMVSPFAGATAPVGWLLCDGAAVSRTNYGDLFNVIGSTYGNGDGSTTFNVPDMRGRFPIGVGTLGTDTYARGVTGGSARHTLSTAELPAHTHGAAGDHGHTAAGAHGHTASTGSDSHSHTANSAGAHTHSLSVDTNSGDHSHGSGRTHDIGAGIYDAAGGTGTMSATIPSGGAHTHSTTSDSHSHTVTVNSSTDHTHPNAGSHTHTSVGGGAAHENRPPYLALNYIIKT